MSSKVSIKICLDKRSGMKAHLYEECLAPDGYPVYLELTGIHEVSLDVSETGNRVTVAIPRGLADALGLLPSRQP